MSIYIPNSSNTVTQSYLTGQLATKLNKSAGVATDGLTITGSTGVTSEFLLVKPPANTVSTVSVQTSGGTVVLGVNTNNSTVSMDRVAMRSGTDFNAAVTMKTSAGVTLFNLDTSGKATTINTTTTFKNNANSATAYQFQQSNATNVVCIDTANPKIILTGTMEAANTSSDTACITIGNYGKLKFTDYYGTNNVNIASPNTVTSSYTMRLPQALPTANNSSIICDTSGNLTFANSASSFNASDGVSGTINYITLPSGVKQYWGTTGYIGTSATYTITFPVSFTNTPSAVCNGLIASVSNSYDIGVYSISSTQVTFSSFGAVGCLASWQCIGL